MTPEDEKTLYAALGIDGGGAAEEEDFSLEEILAEYGGSLHQKLLEDAEAELEPPPAPVPDPAVQEPSRPDPAPPKEVLPPSPRPIPMEEVVGRTVDAVMEEQAEPLLQPRRGLFSRRRLVETEELYQRPEPDPDPAPEEPEPIGPEETAADAAADYRAQWYRRKAPIPAAACAALIPVVLLAADRYGRTIPFWSGDPMVQSVALLCCVALVSALGWNVFAKGFGALARRRCVSELLVSLSALVAAADCVARLLLPDRSDAMPYAAVSCVAMVFAMWGGARESRGMYDTFRAAAMDDDPPYLLTETGRGACKQRGSLPGFYSTALGDDLATLWQTALLPVILMASIVFAGLSSLGQGRGADFLLNWSAILSAGATFALPLCWGLPWSRLARRLQKTGCALGGWLGAEKISRKKSMIVTDTDLFPPGTIQLNGVKLFGEELAHAASYAASLTQAAGCGLLRLFDGMMRSEGGAYLPVEDFSFYEEGGYSGAIRGESVLLGTASFMRKMDVRLPGGINLKTGVFLAVDRQLTAVFAVKYNPAENVDWALRMMRRSHVMPILAARDPNITPNLLKRKFSKGVKVEYPDLTARVALSEAELDRGIPRALLLREGLLPYAETVVGSRRLCKTVRQAAALSLVSSAVGTLLAFYLVFQQAYGLMSPLSLLAFLLLWTLPVGVGVIGLTAF